jgi:hypothetical protein
MDRVYIVSVDGVPYAAFTEYEKATDFVGQWRAIEPYARYEVDEVPVDTAVIKRVYQVNIDVKGNVKKSSYASVFENEADLNEREIGASGTGFGGVAATSLIGFDDAIARGKEFMDKQRQIRDNLGRV